jgi:hypothetical protein
MYKSVKPLEEKFEANQLKIKVTNYFTEGH